MRSGRTASAPVPLASCPLASRPRAPPRTAAARHKRRPQCKAAPSPCLWSHHRSWGSTAALACRRPQSLGAERSGSGSQRSGAPRTAGQARCTWAAAAGRLARRSLRCIAEGSRGCPARRRAPVAALRRPGSRRCCRVAQCTGSQRGTTAERDRGRAARRQGWMRIRTARQALRSAPQSRRCCRCWGPPGAVTAGASCSEQRPAAAATLAERQCAACPHCWGGWDAACNGRRASKQAIRKASGERCCGGGGGSRHLSSSAAGLLAGRPAGTAACRGACSTCLGAESLDSELPMPEAPTRALAGRRMTPGSAALT